MAADAALVVGWNRAVGGREKAAMELFNESLALYGKMVGEKKLDSFEPVILSPHGGDLNGFILIRGSGAQIDSFRRSAEFESLMVRGLVSIEGLGANHAYIGDGANRIIGTYLQAIAK